MQNTCSNTLELLYRPSFEKSLLMQCCFTFILFSEKIEALFSTFAQFLEQFCINGIAFFQKACQLSPLVDLQKYCKSVRKRYSEICLFS